MNLLCPGDEKQLRAVFVSGNEDKVKDVLKVLGDEMVLITQKIDLVEIQGQPVEVAIQKCVEAKKFSQETVIIEDTGKNNTVIVDFFFSSLHECSWRHARSLHQVVHEVTRPDRHLPTHLWLQRPQCNRCLYCGHRDSHRRRSKGHYL